MTTQPGALVRAALSDWTERWVPDAFIFALAATGLVFAAAISATPFTAAETVDPWGRGFWELIPFTLQMSLVIITGHVLATSPPMTRAIRAGDVIGYTIVVFLLLTPVVLLLVTLLGMTLPYSL